MPWIKETNDGAVLEIRVVPRGSATRVEGVLGDALKIRLQAPPVDGKANKALVKFLSKMVGVPARCVELISGESCRNKRVLLHGVDVASATSKLNVPE